MKRLLIIALASITMMSMSACGKDAEKEALEAQIAELQEQVDKQNNEQEGVTEYDDEKSEEDVEDNTEVGSEIEAIHLNEVAKTDNFDISVKRAKFTKMGVVYVNMEFGDTDWLLPLDDVSNPNAMSSPEDGKTYFVYEIDINYLGKEEKSLGLGNSEGDFIDLALLYADGFRFDSYVITGSIDGEFWDDPYDWDGNGYMTNLSNIAFSFEPLETHTHYFRGFFEVPEQVGADEEPLYLEISIDNQQLLVDVR